MEQSTSTQITAVIPWYFSLYRELIKLRYSLSFWNGNTNVDIDGRALKKNQKEFDLSMVRKVTNPNPKPKSLVGRLCYTKSALRRANFGKVSISGTEATFLIYGEQRLERIKSDIAKITLPKEVKITLHLVDTEPREWTGI